MLKYLRFYNLSKKSQIICIFCGLICFNLTSYAEEKTTDHVIVTINDHPITQQDYDNYVAARANGDTALPGEQLLLEELINRELVIQGAIKSKIDQTPKFIKQMDILRGNLLTTTYISEYLQQHQVDEKILRTEYDKRVTIAKMPKEYKVRHILLASEEQAKTVLIQLKEGVDFSKLAEEKSIDSGSARMQGDLGWITREQVTPEVANVIVDAEKGKYLDPIKSSFGWHVVIVDDVRQTMPPSFEEVKADLETMMQSEKLQELLDELRENAAIKYTDKTKINTDKTIEK